MQLLSTNLVRVKVRLYDKTEAVYEVHTRNLRSQIDITRGRLIAVKRNGKWQEPLPDEITRKVIYLSDAKAAAIEAADFFRP